MHGLRVNGSRVLQKLHLQIFRWLIPSAAWLHILKMTCKALIGKLYSQKVHSICKTSIIPSNTSLWGIIVKSIKLSIWPRVKKHSPSALKKTSIMLRLGKCNKIRLWTLSVWLKAITHFCVRERNFCLYCWELSFLDYWAWITSSGYMCPSVNIWAWLKADWASLLTLRLFSGAKLNLN